MKSLANSNLHTAKRAKNDEFYTQLVDIENELKHYRKHFKGKVVLCNCDDPVVSKFFHYFAYNFEFLGLKKLISVSYASGSKKAVYLEYSGDKNGNKVPDSEEIETIALIGDGDFRSDESIALLEEADIVVTNPPFSLFREYVAQLIEYRKKFLIVGNMNAITYKEIFPLLKDNKMWLGVTGFNRGMYFMVPPDFVYADTYKFEREQDGVKVSRVPGVCWFTNLPHDKRNEEIILYRRYLKAEYPKYDNYDAINIDKVKDIPKNYKGVMGVPITFLSKHNPAQFEILGTTDRGGDGLLDYLYLPHSRRDAGVVGGVARYKRIFIRALTKAKS